MPDKRTARDFVRDLCVKGKTDLQVRAVARVTRWAGQIDEVVSWLKRRGERWRAMRNNSSESLNFS